MSHDAVDLENLPVSAEEAHAELEIVLRSPTFDRSERLHKFLRYICELTLKGDAARINEYLIGSEVFQKGPDYNPNEDSIVRRQAHALRKKLHEYYEGEGKSRPIKIELPVGRYVPAFPARGNSRSAACCGTRYRSDRARAGRDRGEGLPKNAAIVRKVVEICAGRRGTLRNRSGHRLNAHIGSALSKANWSGC